MNPIYDKLSNHNHDRSAGDKLALSRGSLHCAWTIKFPNRIMWAATLALAHNLELIVPHAYVWWLNRITGTFSTSQRPKSFEGYGYRPATSQIDAMGTAALLPSGISG